MGGAKEQNPDIIKTKENSARNKLGNLTVEKLIGAFKEKAIDNDIAKNIECDNKDQMERTLGWLYRSNGLCPLESELREWVLATKLDNKESYALSYQEVITWALDNITIRALDRNELVGSQADLEQFFEPFDPERTGKVSRKVFRNLMENVGESFSRADVDEILKECKCDEEGDLLNYKDFLSTIMLKY